MSRGFIPSVSRLTALRDVRSETTAFGLAFFSRESHETNVRLCDGKRPFPAYLFWSRFQREDRKKSHVSHPYREVILRLHTTFAPATRAVVPTVYRKITYPAGPSWRFERASGQSDCRRFLDGLYFICSTTRDSFTAQGLIFETLTLCVRD